MDHTDTKLVHTFVIISKCSLIMAFSTVDVYLHITMTIRKLPVTSNIFVINVKNLFDLLLSIRVMTDDLH